MSNKNGDNITITNTGSIGAIAVGAGATAVQASDNTRVDISVLGAQFDTLDKLIEQHSDVDELKKLLKDAIALSRSDDPSKSIPIWEKIALYGGSIGSVVGGIVALLGG